MYITDTRTDMQSELQWWGEQKLIAMQEGDLVYARECQENIQKLTNDIQYNG